MALLRKLGIRVILYLDDMLTLSTTREGAKKGLAVARELFATLGFVVNTKEYNGPDTVTRVFLDL